MNILLVCSTLRYRQGAEIYARDLALELKRQGHALSIYAAAPGPLADELRAEGVPVETRLRSLQAAPDIIHGNIRRGTLAALLHYPSAPAIAVCHSHAGWLGGAAVHPRIRRYLGMSRLCVERLRAQRLPEEQIRLSWNFVDLARFRPRPPLPARPRRALVFSNYARDSTHLPAVAEACRRAGLELDVVGTGVGNPVSRPEDVLGRYDIVFAKAKAATEAMAVGAATVLCDFGGVGPMVTAAEFDRLRPMNFGFQALRDPLEPECVLRQIERYDACNAAEVRDLLRGCLGVEQAVAELLGVYREVIEEHQNMPRAAARQSARYLAALSCDTLKERTLLAWLRLGPRHQEFLTQLPGAQLARRQVKRLFT